MIFAGLCVASASFYRSSRFFTTDYTGFFDLARQLLYYLAHNVPTDVIGGEKLSG